MFYVFVEESGAVNPEGLMGPDEKAIAGDVFNDALSARSWRIRASGIDAEKFHESLPFFEALDHDNVTDGQRSQRRDNLNEAFGEQPLPIFDLYLGRDDTNYQFLRDIVAPGGWYWIVIRKRSEGDAGLPIFVGAPELPAGPYLPGTLEFLEIVPLAIEYRLRDIFSLVHISDAEFGEEAGGEGEPAPPEPDVGPELEKWQPSRQIYLRPQTLKSSEA